MNLNGKIKIRYQDNDRDDCGAKSIQMAAEYILGDLTEKQYSQIAKGRMRIDKMKEEIKKLGLRANTCTGKDFNSKFDKIKKAINKDLPVIVLYRIFDHHKCRRKRDSHYSVVWGIDQHNIFVYDPYKFTEDGGIKKQPVKISKDEFKIKRVKKGSKIKNWGEKQLGIIVSKSKRPSLA